MSPVSAGNQSPLFICEPAGLAGFLLLRTSLSSSSSRLRLLTAVCVMCCWFIVSTAES